MNREPIYLCKHGCCPRVRKTEKGVYIEDDLGNSVFLSIKEWNDLKCLIRQDRV